MSRTDLQSDSSIVKGAITEPDMSEKISKINISACLDHRVLSRRLLLKGLNFCNRTPVIQNIEPLRKTYSLSRTQHTFQNAMKRKRKIVCGEIRRLPQLKFMYGTFIFWSRLDCLRISSTPNTKQRLT